MGTNYGPRIAADGLVCCLDGATPKSLVSGSTTWNDLAGNGNTGVLRSAVNAIYSTQGGGSVSLNGGASSFVSLGSGGYVTFGSGAFALETWVRPTNVTNGGALLEFRPDNSNGFYPLIAFNTAALGTGLQWYVNGVTRITSTAPLAPNVWNHVVATRTGLATNLYLNGALQGIWPDTSDYLVSPLGPAIGYNAFLGPLFVGQVGVARVYKGVGLTQAQVQQNYAALKGRYGL